jgi:hypothetical protein
MPEIEITVKRRDKKPDKKKGYVLSSEGNFYNVLPPLLWSFEEGGVYKVEYTATPRKDGKGEWLDITKILSRTATSPPKHYNARPPTNPTDSERMWSCAILEAFIRAGKVDLSITSLAEANKIVTTVYANSFGSKDVRKDDEMNDEIPY